MPFAETFLDGVFRTIVMSIGEIEFLDLRYANATKNQTFPIDSDGGKIKGLELEIYLGRLILLAFVFLFVVVVMNLLNAIAIGDIQVKNIWLSRTDKFCLICLQSPDVRREGPEMTYYKWLQEPAFHKFPITPTWFDFDSYL